MCIFIFYPSLSPSNYFPMLLIHSAFLMFSWLPYFTQTLFSFLYIRLLACLRVTSPYFLLDLFYYFGMSCFVCIVLPCLNIFLMFPLSSVHSGLFPRVLLSFFLVLLFPFCPQIFQRFSLFFIFVCCHRFLMCVSSRISQPGFYFLFVFLKGTWFFSQTNFAPA